MSFINTLSWPMWMLLGAITTALVSLYFLKLRRKPIAISSTMLWHQTLEDMHVNSLWQRLRNNLLLWLQLIALGLIAFACLRPGWQGTRSIGERTVLLLDQSASMQAKELGKSRLEIAKEDAKRLVSEMRSNDVAMVVTFSDRVEVKQSFTSDKTKLVDAIDRIEATNRVDDVSDLLGSVVGLLQGTAPENPTGTNGQPETTETSIATTPGETANQDNSDTTVDDDAPTSPKTLPTVFLLSDGGFGKIPDEDRIPVNLQFRSIGSSTASNVAITSFSIQRNEANPDQLEAFARIANFTDSEVTATLSLEVDSSLTDATEIKIEPRKESSVLFELSQVDSGVLKLILDYEDDFPLDNTAYAVVKPNKPLSILLVTEGNNALELALQTSQLRQFTNVKQVAPAFLQSEEFRSNSVANAYDVIVFDGCSPLQMPSANTLFIGSVPPDSKRTSATNQSSLNVNPEAISDAEQVEAPTITAEWTIGEETGPWHIIDVDRAHPLTHFLEMSSVAILSGHSVTPPTGGSVLMLGNHGPALAVAPRGRYSDIVLGFPMISEVSGKPTINTDWGTKRSFPVFVYSSVVFMGGGQRGSSAKSVQPGKPALLELPLSTQEFDIGLDATGERFITSRAGDTSIVFTQTEKLGIYSVLDAQASTSEVPVDYFCVNLFSNKESNLAVPEVVEVGETKLSSELQEIAGRTDIWRWVIALGALVLLLEWTFFSKRVFA